MLAPSRSARLRRAESHYCRSDRTWTMIGMTHADLRRPIASTSPRPRFHRPPRVVLLAADARPADRATVDRAIAIAAREGSKLVALHILPGDHGSQLRDADGPVPLELERIVDRARRAGVDARHVVRYGEVGRETLRAAGELDVDLIVVGRSPGCGYLLRHSDRPTVVIHPWAQVGPGWDEPLQRHRFRPQEEVETSRTEVNARRIPIEAGRVACPLLGVVPLDRCLECDRLIRVESTQRPTACRVVCVDRGQDYGEAFSW